MKFCLKGGNSKELIILIHSYNTGFNYYHFKWCGMKIAFEDNKGFTLIELVMAIVILGILAAVAVPRVGSIIDNSRINTTKSNMGTLKQALLGDPDARTHGVATDKGYIGDVGYAPIQLQDLVVKPAADPAWNRFLGTGWNGPYIIDDGTGNYLKDAWGNALVYDRVGKKIISSGPDGVQGTGDDITLLF